MGRLGPPSGTHPGASPTSPPTADAGQDDLTDLTNLNARSSAGVFGSGLNSLAIRASQGSASRLAWAEKRLSSSRVVWEPVTRVVRWSGADVVVRVTTRTDVIVAIPRAMPSREVLDLASLVLSAQEHQELQRRFECGPPAEAGVRASAGRDSDRSRR